MGRENDYRVEEVPGKNDTPSYLIIRNELPYFEVNLFLQDKSSFNTFRTARTYAYRLVVWLRYLDSMGVDFKKATRRQFKAFFKYLQTGGNQRLKSMKATKTRATLLNYKAAINAFYSWWNEEMNADMPLVNDEDIEISNAKAYLQRHGFNVVWNKGNGRKDYLKGVKFKVKKKYIRWYTPEEIEAIASNFRTARDRIIFLIQCECGPRIDEVCNLKYEDFDCTARTIDIKVSKTRPRLLGVKSYLANEIENYCQTERARIEAELGRVCEYLFLTHSGKTKGEQLHYHNYRKILIRAANRAGLNPITIKTHAGRSTWVENLLERERKHNDISQLEIKYLAGWASDQSIEDYKKTLSPERAIEIAEKVKVRERV